ncbi:MAG: WD40 repeat domain-containing protein [Chloroflexota bacterium]
MRTARWILLLVVFSVVPSLSILGQAETLEVPPTPVHISKENYPLGSKSPLAFSPDGTRIVFPLQVTDEANTGKTGIADAATGTLLYYVKGDLVSLVSPNNRIVTFDATTGQFLYWNIASSQAGQQLDSFSVTTQFNDGLEWLYVSTDFHTFVTADGNVNHIIWDLTTGKEITSSSGRILSTGHDGRPSYSPDASLLANRNPDGTLSVVDTATWNKLYQLSVSGGIQIYKFSADGKSIVTGNTDQTVTLWDSTTGRTIAAFTPGVTPDLLAVTDDRTRIAVASADGEAVLWNTLFQQPVLNLSVGAVVEIDLNKDATRLATWPNQGDLQIWDLTAAQEALSMTSEPVPGQ